MKRVEDSRRPSVAAPWLRRYLRCAALLTILTLPSGAAIAQYAGAYTAWIYRDELGIGHVYGEYDADVAYGVGRLIARDKPLRTMFALTVASGGIARVFGAGGPTEQYWIRSDRKVLACGIPAQAQALWTQYLNSSAPEDVAIRDLIIAYVEGVKDEIWREGPGFSTLASVYVTLAARPDWPYGSDLKTLSHTQFMRLFERADPNCAHPLQYWEVLAALHYYAGGVSSMRGGPQREEETDEGVEPPALEQMFGFGSSSWGILDEANGENGRGFLQADSHNPGAWGHTIRFKSLYGKLDAGGVAWEGLGPFLANGAFTHNVAWATMLCGTDDRDARQFHARPKAGGGFEYEDYDVGQQALVWRTIDTQLTTIYYWEGTGSGVLMTLKPRHYLSTLSTAPGTVPVWASEPENDDWGTLIVNPVPPYTTIRAPQHSALEPGTGNDPKVDMARTFYRMLVAETADQLVETAFDQQPWSWPLHFLIGSGKRTTLTSQQQLTFVTHGRIPYRQNEYVVSSPPPWWWQYAGDLETWNDSHCGHRWMIDNGRMFHVPAHYPIAKAHDRPGQEPKIKFMANCNTTAEWIFGRNVPFPGWDTLELVGGVSPRYQIPDSSPYQYNPIVTGDTTGERPYLTWLTQLPANGGLPPAITGSYWGASGYSQMLNTFGAITLRQEWVLRRLQEAYESRTPHSITETEMQDLINDPIDAGAYYMQRLKVTTLTEAKTWFVAARDYLIGESMWEEADLMQAFDEWAKPSTLQPPQPSASLEDDSVVPIQWCLFWRYFTGESQLTTIEVRKGTYFTVPLHAYWREPGSSTLYPAWVEDEEHFNSGFKEAVSRVCQDTLNLDPGHRIRAFLLVRTPFLDDAEYGVAGFNNTLKGALFKGWIEEPGPGVEHPRMQVSLVGRLPLLVRFGNSTQDPQKVWLMNPSIVSDRIVVSVLPEWNYVVNGVNVGLARYKESVKRAAEGERYELPLTEAELQQITPPPFMLVVTNVPWARR
ncbi:MAG: penicillin acylase family protein [Phycisphaerae bacterium]|nr:penicillin acylase family protein [Phycisphaerae bacterium]